MFQLLLCKNCTMKQSFIHFVLRRHPFLVLRLVDNKIICHNDHQKLAVQTCLIIHCCEEFEKIYRSSESKYMYLQRRLKIETELLCSIFSLPLLNKRYYLEIVLRLACRFVKRRWIVALFPRPIYSLLTVTFGSK